MGSYIARRLLLMIPTLIGITFLVFMLVALSPGGIGAALRASGGQMDASSAALQEAYLEDRYGLDDPAPLQYMRWLGRICPIKFGERAQRTPQGEHVQAPKPVKEPLLWRWHTDALPTEPAPEVLAWGSTTTDEERLRAYRVALGEYAQARARFIGLRATYRSKAAEFLKATGYADLVNYTGKFDEDDAAELSPDRGHPQWGPLQLAFDEQANAYAAALSARSKLLGVFRSKPFPEVGVAIIPEYLSFGPPDLGSSFARGQPVSDLILRHLPVTLLLNFIAFPLIYLIAIPSGMLQAARKGTWIDTSLGGLVVALWSIPTVWAGVLAVGYLANRRYLDLFPVSGLHSGGADDMTFLPRDGEIGFLLDTLWHLCLPVACLVYGGFAVLSKQTRAAMLDNYNADFVRTAKAKGVAPLDITFRHVLRNSLLPLITMFATIFPAMLSGSVVIERIFTVPGMGSLIIEAISLRDRELLLANTLMIACVNLLALLLADILYAIADPRIAYK